MFCKPRDDAAAYCSVEGRLTAMMHLQEVASNKQHRRCSGAATVGGARYGSVIQGSWSWSKSDLLVCTMSLIIHLATRSLQAEVRGAEGYLYRNTIEPKQDLVGHSQRAILFHLGHTA